MTAVEPIVIDEFASAEFGTSDSRELLSVPELMFDAFVVSVNALATSVPPAPTFSAEPSVPANVRLVLMVSDLPSVPARVSDAVQLSSLPAVGLIWVASRLNPAAIFENSVRIAAETRPDPVAGVPLAL